MGDYTAKFESDLGRKGKPRKEISWRRERETDRRGKIERERESERFDARKKGFKQREKDRGEEKGANGLIFKF